MNLLEQYAKRLQVSESVHAKAHGGASMSNSKKMAVAMVLNNTNKFLTEAFDNSVGTQRSDMGMFKKFCLNLTTVALPNLIAHDLVIVHPMASMSGYITYVKYTAGSNKGNTVQGDVFNDPFRLGKVDPNYTASTVVKDYAVATGTTFQNEKLDWTPVVPGTVVVTSGTDKFYDDGKGNLIKNPTSVTRMPIVNQTNASGHLEGTPGRASVVIEGGTNGGFVVYGANDTTTDRPNPGIYLTTAIQGGEGVSVNVSYVYNNVVIPQNDLPIINAEMASIPLIAKARRVAVYYSQIAAFQAKTDYGFDLGEQLASKAVGQLSYEIDTEITNLLINSAATDADLTFNKANRVGVSKAEHYEGFAELIGIAKQKIYDRTRRYMPNYMLIASDILPILSFLRGFRAAPVSVVNGPYLAGTLDGIKVYVTPNIAPGKFVLGVNGDDMMSSAAVFAPYMAIVPTQLLGYADGGMSQGWSTLYALELLNKDLLIAGTVINEPGMDAAFGVGSISTTAA